MVYKSLNGLAPYYLRPTYVDCGSITRKLTVPMARTSYLTYFQFRNSHCEIEKRRRDEMNQYINDLSTMIPLPPSVGKKPDKLTVLKFAVQHMKALQGTVHKI
jgi:hypothetical protein